MAARATRWAVTAVVIAVVAGQSTAPPTNGPTPSATSSVASTPSTSTPEPTNGTAATGTVPPTGNTSSTTPVTTSTSTPEPVVQSQGGGGGGGDGMTPASWAIVSVCAVIVVAAILFIVLWRPKRRGNARFDRGKIDNRHLIDDDAKQQVAAYDYPGYSPEPEREEFPEPHIVDHGPRW
jgi:hypothetical protein